MTAIVAATVSLPPSIDVTATRATSDRQLIASWLDGFQSAATRRNFAATAERFLAYLESVGLSLRTATVEDVREAIGSLADGHSPATLRQYRARVKSLLGYAHSLGYTPFNAGAALKDRGHQRAERAAAIVERRMSEVEVSLLLRECETDRDKLLLGLAYAAGLRVSELVGLRWEAVSGDAARVQLSIMGKGLRPRQIVLGPEISAKLIAYRGDGKSGGRFVFEAERDGGRQRTGGGLSPQSVSKLVKRCAERAGLSDRISPHWLRHAHASHALANGADLTLVRDTLGHGDISTTGAYLHAAPGDGSALYLDGSIFKRL